MYDTYYDFLRVLNQTVEKKEVLHLVQACLPQSQKSLLFLQEVSGRAVSVYYSSVHMFVGNERETRKL